MLRIKAINLISLLLSISLLWACEQNLEPDEDRLGYTYMPLETGSFIRYDVEKITYTVLDPPLTERYQLREVVGESFTDPNGDTAYKITRYKRNTPAEPWQADSLWSAKKTNIQAIRIENSQPIVKIRFPVAEGLSWDANALNANTDNDYQIVSVNTPFTIGSQTFPNTLVVAQDEDCSKVSLNRNTEVFARDVGLIYKQQWNLSFCISPECIAANNYCEEADFQTLPNETLIDFGTVITQQVVEYGKE